MGNLTSGRLMPLLSHTTAGAGGSGRLLESQPVGGKEHCEPIPPTPSAHHDDRRVPALSKQVRSLRTRRPSLSCPPTRPRRASPDRSNGGGKA